MGLGFRFWVSGFRGLGFTVWELGFRAMWGYCSRSETMQTRGSRSCHGAFWNYLHGQTYQLIEGFVCVKLVFSGVHDFSLYLNPNYMCLNSESSMLCPALGH